MEGIIHRDVKPANIRVDNHGAVYLMDFGIAYRPDSGEVALPPGMILGTPAYLRLSKPKEDKQTCCRRATNIV